MMAAGLAAIALFAGCGGSETPAPPAATTTQKAPGSTPPPAAPVKAPGAPATGAPAAATAGGPVSPSPLPEPPRFTYDPRGRRDPFRPLVVARATPARPKTGLASLDPEDLKLTGVVWDQKGYYALVEAPNGLGYVIRTNDVIGDDARVTRITPEGMTLDMAAQADLPRPGAGNRRLLEIKLRKEEER